MKKPLSKSIKALYGVGDFGYSLKSSVEAYFFVYFLTSVARFPLPWVAVIGSVTTIVDAILSPVYGGILTAVKPMRWGRNRSWILLAPPIVLIAYLFQFSKIGGDLLAAVIICAAFIIGKIFENLGFVSNLNLIPTLASTPQEQGLLSSRRTMYTSGSQILFSYMGAPLIALYGVLTGSESLGYTLVAGTMGILLWIGYLITFRITRGYEDTFETGVPAPAAKEKVALGDMLKGLIGNPHLLILLLADFFRWVATFVYITVMAFYFSYVVGNIGLMPLYLLLSSIGNFTGASISGPLSKKFAPRNLMLCSVFGMGVALVIGKLAGLAVIAVFICGILSKIFWGASYAWNVVLYSNASVYSEWKTRKNTTPFIMGLMSLPMKIGTFVSRGIVVPLALALGGFVSDMDPALASPALKGAMLNVFMLIPGLVTLFAFILLFLGYRLNSETIARYQEEIRVRKESETA